MRGIQNRIILKIIWSVMWKEFCIRDFFRVKKNSSHVLMFHDIVSVKRYDKKDYSIDETMFQHIIDWHIKNEYVFMPVESLKNEYIGNKRCMLTFDDGFSSVLKLIPYLEINNIPFCIYIITSKIDKDGYLTKSQIEELSLNPLCTIGSHTCSHERTRMLDSEKLMEELITSKKIIETIIGKRVDHFAFPYGHFEACSIFDCYYVRKAGYKTAVVTKQLPLPKHIRNHYTVPRFDATRKNILEIL